MEWPITSLVTILPLRKAGLLLMISLCAVGVVMFLSPQCALFPVRESTVVAPLPSEMVAQVAADRAVWMFIGIFAKLPHFE